jgi:hypothetical protein
MIQKVYKNNHNKLTSVFINTILLTSINQHWVHLVDYVSSLGMRKGLRYVYVRVTVSVSRRVSKNGYSSQYNDYRRFFEVNAKRFRESKGVRAWPLLSRHVVTKSDSSHEPIYRQVLVVMSRLFRLMYGLHLPRSNASPAPGSSQPFSSNRKGKRTCKEKVLLATVTK